MKSLKITFCMVLILCGYKQYANILSDTSSVRQIVVGYHMGMYNYYFPRIATKPNG